MRPPTLLPLERKLPLLLTGLLAALLAVGLFFTYRTLARAAELSAHERLGRAAHSIAATVETAIRDRARRLRQLAGDPAFIAAVRTRDAAKLAAHAQRSRSSADSLSIEVWDRNGNSIFRHGNSVLPEERNTALKRWIEKTPLTSLPADSVTFTPLYDWGGRVYFWGIADILDGGSRLGYLAVQRRTAGPRDVVASLSGLIGEDVQLQLRNRDDQFRSNAPGEPASPARRDSSGRVPYDFLASGEQMIAAEAPVAGSPWMVVLLASRDSVIAPARATLLRLALLSAVLAAVGAAASWAISRRLARPLASLTTAAEAVAQGDYTRRVEVTGDDEVARLAASFNKMAAEIAASGHALERRTREAEIAREESEKANRAKADFLAVMSHELRTPLNAISGYTDLLNLGIYGPLGEEQREALRRITRNQEHLLALINDVLNFAKIDAGQVEFDIADVPVDTALHAVEPLIAPLLRAKGLEFVYAPCDPRVTVRADADKLRQVLLNLLTNAVKYTPAGGTVSMTCDTADSHVFIRVADTGPGIPERRLKSIFDPFVQGDRALNRPNEGVGLGLAISRELTIGMDGELQVASELDRGSVFTVKLMTGAPLV